MIRPVKGSDLAKQIELARQDIERWPQWLKDAAGIFDDEADQSDRTQKTLRCWPRLSPADFMD